MQHPPRPLRNPHELPGQTRGRSDLRTRPLHCTRARGRIPERERHSLGRAHTIGDALRPNRLVQVSCRHSIKRLRVIIREQLRTECIRQQCSTNSTDSKPSGDPQQSAARAVLLLLLLLLVFLKVTMSTAAVPAIAFTRMLLIPIATAAAMTAAVGLVAVLLIMRAVTTV